jgi:hypothetical protein
MKRIILYLFLVAMVLSAEICNAGVIFKSRWDNANLSSNNLEDDGGVWHYAYVGHGNISLERVSGDQSNLGGPLSLPPGSNATHMLRETWIPNGQDGQVYLQANFPAQYQNLTDYYGGMWVFFQNGIQFIDSVKFFDFRTSNPAAGNGHLALFGFDHRSFGCQTATHGYNVATELLGYPYGHNIMVFRYLAAPGQSVSGNEYMLNYYDSPIFESNIDANGSPVSDLGYSVNSPDRVKVEGGYWIGFIFHARIHEKNGRYECWIKKGDDPLRKVMDWNPNTLWPQGEGPHDFYTKNGSVGVDHIQINAYWNGWPSASGTRRIWISDVVVATTFEEVSNFLMGTPSPPTGLRIVD